MKASFAAFAMFALLIPAVSACRSETVSFPVSGLNVDTIECQE